VRFYNSLRSLAIHYEKLSAHWFGCFNHYFFLTTAVHVYLSFLQWCRPAARYCKQPGRQFSSPGHLTKMSMQAMKIITWLKHD
jgi:hypothetical protein